MFWRKLLIAGVLAPPFIWVWYQGFPWLNALMAVFAAVAANEVVGMGVKENALRSRLTAVVCAVVLFLPYGFTVPYSVSAAVMFSLAAVFLVHLFSTGDMTTVAHRISVTLLAVIYAAVPIGYLILLRQDPVHGRGLAFVALSMSWFCDTFAYFGGRLYGRTKLYEKVSPNKTIEGLLSGMAAAGIGAFIEMRLFGLPWSPAFAIILGVVSGAWGQLGDLAESLLKRSFGVKDSGRFLGSHGGVLDRFDAVLFVSPLIYFAHYVVRDWL